MTRDELSTRIRACLGRIAPEVDVGALEPAARLRDQVDLDSVDWLNFLVAVHADLGSTSGRGGGAAGDARSDHRLLARRGSGKH